MRRWTRCFYFLLVLGIGAAGCKSTAAGTITLSPLTPVVLVNNMVQFTAAAPSDTATITWSVNSVNGGNTTVGTIDSTGLYTAPAVVPPNTTITVTATQGNASGSTTVTVDSGTRVTVSPAAATVGTLETFPFTATVTGVPVNAVIAGTCSNVTNTPVPCNAVTWSIASTTGNGGIGTTSGIYTAPPAAHTDTITATSVYDTSETATATITVVTAADPTITSISPKTGAVGALFEDVYLTGTSFISTTSVFINGNAVSPLSVLVSPSFTTLLVRVPDTLLNALGTLTFQVARQGGAQQTCLTPANCQLVRSAVRPAIVGASPDSIPQGGAATTNFNIDGGYFGTASVVTTLFGGQPRAPQPSTANPTRQLGVSIGGADVSTPGLFPVEVVNQSGSVPPAVVNVAIQPRYSNASPVSAVTPLGTLPVGTTPTSIAIDRALGLAVVANQGTNDVTLIDLTHQPNPAVVVASLCTGSTGAVSEPCPGAPTGPISVAVDDVFHLALVVNRTAETLSVINLQTRTVVAANVPSSPPGTTSSSTSNPSVPVAVGINSATHTALVAYQTSGYASIFALLPSPQAPTFTGIVSISNGGTPRISVSNNLNWALVTPGGSGLLSIVDLGQQTATPIAASGAAVPGISCNSGTVTVTTTAGSTLQTGQAVLISGVANTSFDGVFDVLSVLSSTDFTYSQSTCVSGQTSGDPGTGAAMVSSALPVADLETSQTVTGVAFNDETDKAILVDTAANTSATIFNALDQSSTAAQFSSPLTVGNIAAAFNPLANIAVVVNDLVNMAIVVDPTTPSFLGAPFAVGNHPIDVAIDPGTDDAVIVNQMDGTVSIFSLGALRTPQIVETTPAQITVGSTLTSGVGAAGSPPVNPVTLTIVGYGFAAGTVARLDGTPLPTTVVSNRVITATVTASMEMAPRRYALDVASGTSISNAESFAVIQSIDVTSACTSTPVTPQAVAIDPQQNIAVVTNFGCANVSLINLATGTGQTVAVGNGPVGVAVLPSAAEAVVANFTDGTASVVDEIGATAVATVTLDSNPTGVAIDPLLGDAAVVCSGANTVDLFSVGASPGTPTSLTVGNRPGAVAINPATHLAAVANVADNTVSLVDLTQTVATITVSGLSLPEGVAFDPISADFLVSSSLGNSVDIVDPVAQTSTFVRVGINPTSLAYNFASSTLVTMNSASNTMTMVDFLGRQVEAVFPVKPSSNFSVAIHPFTNLAVVADSTDSTVLLFPLPR
jgi:DNA-binding beta-propeller fold protein YncE